MHREEFLKRFNSVGNTLAFEEVWHEYELVKWAINDTLATMEQHCRTSQAILKYSTFSWDETLHNKLLSLQGEYRALHNLVIKMEKAADFKQEVVNAK